MASRNEDTLAIDIYRRAEESGEPITLGTVERRLSPLLVRLPADKPGLAGPSGHRLLLVHVWLLPAAVRELSGTA